MPTKEDNPSELLLTRAQTARRLGVSIATVRRMEGAELAPVVVDGKHLFHANEVEKYARVDDGELASLAFEAFERGDEPIAVVIALRQPPEKIEALHNAWMKMGRSITVGAPSHFSLRGIEQLFGSPKLNWAMLCCAVEIVARDPKMRDEWKARVLGRYPEKWTGG